MRSATLRLDDLKTTILNLGFVGENEHRQIMIDCKKMFDEYPHAAASLSVSPPEGESYPAVVERDGDFVIWTITDSDVAVDGDGELQLSFTQEPHLAKTYVGRFKICRSIIPTGDIPSGIDDFITRAGAALTAIPETIDAALEEAKESGEFDGPPGPKGDKGDRGEAGYTPQKGIDYFDGEPGAPGKDGKDGYTPVKGVDYFDGQDGQPGADGFSPSASVSKSGKVATITITDKTGTTTAEITDGEDADPADLIDDTQESDEKTWSSSKIAEDDRALLSQIDACEDSVDGISGELPIDVSGLTAKALFINTSTNVIATTTSDRLIGIPVKGIKAIKLSCSVSSTKRLGFSDSVSQGATVTGVQEITGTLDVTVYNTGNKNYLILQFFIASDTEQDVSVYMAALTTNAITAVDLVLRAKDVPVTVSGTTPTITGVANTRYVCGTCSTLSITPPQTGIIDVVFSSGSTPTVLTVPNTVKFPAWFDTTALAANCTYEINIMDGTLGSVMAWT